LSELGILRCKSKAADSLWVKIGGEAFETRVREGLLEIKAKSAMLGYLNAPSPFTDDGWFKTGDLVEVDGECFRILGRKSDLINVGGEKVYPAKSKARFCRCPESSRQW
jgi:acyl-CoA synthetase (AMP-forming)/AMP-acid ligase II